ncbi:MAG: efflux RND transporter periplasmic adaptor subunit, partial [Candidatus Margulisiibacteriota bacterium]
MKKKKWILWVLVALIIIALGAFFYMRSGASVKVNVHTVGKGTITATINTSGVVDAKIAELGSGLGGKVQWIGVKEGQTVSPNQLLAKIESYDTASKDYERTKALFDKGYATAQQLENARSMLDNKRIVSPIRGVVTRSTLDPGEVATPGVPFLTVVDLSALWIEIQIDEVDIKEASLGQKAIIISDAYVDQEFPGQIEWINYKAEIKKVAGMIRPDEEDKIFRARVSFSDGVQEKFKPGMSVNVDLVVKEKPDALVVPRESVLTIDGKNYVYVISNGRAKQREVQLGLTTP